MNTTFRARDSMIVSDLRWTVSRFRYLFIISYSLLLMLFYYILSSLCQAYRLNICFTLTFRTSEAGIRALRMLPCGVGSRYTSGTVYQRLASEAGIPALFSNAYWNLNARVIEIQTRQQLKNNVSHETQLIFVNKFCIWTPSGQRSS